ncbi:MAG: hypothetical protein FJ319_08365 [SAR202 cluster bacterium]|nr:hypothetical protein [SAR202 cluster bacterium]
MNDDGVADLVLGAPMRDVSGSSDKGQVYVVFGELPTSTFDIDAARDITFNGIDGSDFSGRSIAVGDLNADGINDLVIGADGARVGSNFNAGEVYVLFGQHVNGTYQLSSSTTTNVTFTGTDANDLLGISVAIGDINGDGFRDLAIGASLAEPAGLGASTNYGDAYVVFGPLTPGTYAIASAYDIVVSGTTLGDHVGYDLDFGDIDNDGNIDFVIGAPGEEPGATVTNQGATAVIFGPMDAGTFTFTAAKDLVFYGIDSADQSGGAVAVGDLNGDGIDDLAIGAWTGDPGGRRNAGETYVVYGPWTQPGSYYLSSSTTTSVTINGVNANDFSGQGVAVGDVNNDGIDDLVIGAPQASSYAGKAYVYFGPFGIGTVELSSGTDVRYDGYSGTNALFGRGVRVGDVDGDRLSDLLIGAPQRYIGGVALKDRPS